MKEGIVDEEKSKIIIIAISVIFVILVSIAVFDRYCWKYFDYYFCTDPKSGLSYQGIDVQDNKVDVYFIRERILYIYGDMTIMFKKMYYIWALRP